MTTYLRAGLRFDRIDAPRLRDLAHRAAQRELTEAHDLFANAATAASQGEPLVVFCADIAELQTLAEGFIARGVRRPAIEQLSGIN